MNTTDCLRSAAGLDYLLELAPQICEIIRMGRLLRGLNHDLLIGPRYLLMYDFDVVVSTTVIVPDFTASNRISDSEIEGLLRAEKNVCQFDLTIKRSLMPLRKDSLYRW